MKNQLSLFITSNLLYLQLVQTQPAVFELSPPKSALFKPVPPPPPSNPLHLLAELVILYINGAQESNPRNEFRQHK
jgi:hypothetical protein